MWGLLKETVQEIIGKPLDMAKCFWSSAIFAISWLTLIEVMPAAEVESASISKIDGFVFAVVAIAMFALFALTVTPGVIRWHRLLITNQPSSWLPLAPMQSTLLYTMLVALTIFLFVAISKILGSLYQDLLLPIIGLLNVGADIPWLFVRLQNPFLFGEFSMTFVAAFILGRLYMRLPEIAVEQSHKGARSNWTKSERWNFYVALGLLFLIPTVSDFALNYFWPETLEQTGYLLLLLVQIALATFCWIASITLMSVAYRRNLEKHSVVLKVSP
jgi:hypothetical protein